MSDYNFTGFSSPSIGMLFCICIDIEDWLAKSPDNIAVVHCYVPSFLPLHARTERAAP